MKVIVRGITYEGGGIIPPITVELTRRNLEVLLAKLDQNRRADEEASTVQSERSLCTISKDGIAVRAVEDAAHYDGREYPPGPMLVDGRLI